MKLIVFLIAVVALCEVQCIEEDSFEDYYDSSDYWNSLESEISKSGPSPDIAATNTVDSGEEKFSSDYFDDYIDEDYDDEDEEDEMASLWDNSDSITEQLGNDESSAENESFISTSDSLSTWSYSKYLEERELERSLRVRQLIYILVICGCVLLALLFMLLALHLKKIAKAQKATSLYYTLYEEA